MNGTYNLYYHAYFYFFIFKICFYSVKYTVHILVLRDVGGSKDFFTRIYLLIMYLLFRKSQINKISLLQDWYSDLDDILLSKYDPRNFSCYGNEKTL